MMAVVSSTYVKRRRNNGWDIIQIHTDSEGRTHNLMFWRPDTMTDAEIEADIAVKVAEIDLALAEREAAQILGV